VLLNLSYSLGILKWTGQETRFPKSSPVIVIPIIKVITPRKIIQPKPSCVCDASRTGSSPGKRKADVAEIPENSDINSAVRLH
jgi:hypothetical protein